jgi:ABC-type branched-subunit amino acid transport system ATPase component
LTNPVLVARDLTAGYHGVPAIHDLNLVVHPGELILLAGANGAGKTTTVKALSGYIPVMGGSIELLGAPSSQPLHARIRLGMGLVTETRTITMGLTVRENLRLGRGTVEEALAHFPELEPRTHVKAGLLSGGEQQMLSLGRVLAAKPKVILVDELSQGLAPIIVKRLIKALRTAADRGTGVLLVEQHVRMALTVVDRAYLIRSGHIHSENNADQLRNDSDLIRDAYL